MTYGIVCYKKYFNIKMGLNLQKSADLNLRPQLYSCMHSIYRGCKYIVNLCAKFQRGYDVLASDGESAKIYCLCIDVKLGLNSNLIG